MILLSADQHQGKTSLILDVVSLVQARGLCCAGIACPGLWADQRRCGFDLLELDTGRRSVLSRRIPGLRPIPYMFDAAGLKQGLAAMAPKRCEFAHLVVVDEVGPLELAGGGWARCLPPLLSLTGPVQVWVVRRSLVQAVQEHFQLQAEVLDLDRDACLPSLLRSVSGAQGKRNNA